MITYVAMDAGACGVEVGIAMGRLHRVGGAAVENSEGGKSLVGLSLLSGDMSCCESNLNSTPCPGTVGADRFRVIREVGLGTGGAVGTAVAAG